METGRYRVTLEDLEKRDPQRRLKVLRMLTRGPWTPKDVAGAFLINHTTAYRLLKRLAEQDLVSCDDGKPTYHGYYRITEKGQDRIRLLESRSVEPPQFGEEESTKYPELSTLGTGFAGLVEGPVALMRLVEIDSIEEATRRVPERDLVAEKKFDGWLSQTAGGRLYSRRGKDLTGKFPPIDREIRAFKGEHLVGELVYWLHETGKMDEPSVTRVAGSDLPEAAAKFERLERRGFFQVVYFDLIAQGGKDISKLPFAERRKRLEGLIRSVDSRKARLTLSPIFPLEEWRSVYDEALEEGGEGVVLKNVRAPYFWRELGDREPQPVGVQFKLKAVRSDDFVVFDSYRSEKESLIVRFGQFWKGELIEVGELNNFSTDIEEKILELLKRGPFVMEIGFQERFPKPPGRLRNPRFIRFRPDKAIEDATLPPQFAPRD